MIINSIFSKVLSEFADKLEREINSDDTINQIIKENLRNHRRIIYNGDCYSANWVTEAQKRGIPKFHNGLEAISSITELIEVRTILQIVVTDIIPSIMDYKEHLCTIIDLEKKSDLDIQKEINILHNV